MPTLYPELRQELIAYKQAGISVRAQILGTLLQDVKELPHDVKNAEDCIKATTKLAFTATHLNYAQTLARIETQEFFDILFDFVGLPLVFNEKFPQLNDFFEFHEKMPQMRLKKPLSEFSTDIWQQFQNAQREHLKLIKKEHVFRLELDVNHPPVDSLYPLPIQMLGRLENEAVDRICPTKEGLYRFAHRFSSYLLPGGGMVEIDISNSKIKLLTKMIDEHLEEEHGNLWEKAAEYYNQLDTESFKKSLLLTLGEKSFAALPEKLKHDLSMILNSELKPANILANMIKLIDIAINSSQAFRKDLNTLRASVQVNPFKLHDLYKKTIQFVSDNTECFDIEQFGDVRAAGGKQISHLFSMTKPLDIWFSQHFHNAPCELADDIRNSEIVYKSLLELIAEFKKIKFSHLLNVLTNHNQCLKSGELDFDVIWNPKQYEAALDSVKSSCDMQYQSILELDAASKQQQKDVSASLSMHSMFAQSESEDEFSAVKQESNLNGLG